MFIFLGIFTLEGWLAGWLARKLFENSKMSFFNGNISMGGVDNVDEYKKVALDINKVKIMSKVLNSTY